MPSARYSRRPGERRYSQTFSPRAPSPCIDIDHTRTCAATSSSCLLAHWIGGEALFTLHPSELYPASPSNDFEALFRISSIQSITQEHCPISPCPETGCPGRPNRLALALPLPLPYDCVAKLSGLTNSPFQIAAPRSSWLSKPTKRASPSGRAPARGEQYFPDLQTPLPPRSSNAVSKDGVVGSRHSVCSGVSPPHKYDSTCEREPPTSGISNSNGAPANETRESAGAAERARGSRCRGDNTFVALIGC